MTLLARPRIFDVDVLGGVALLVFGVVAWFGVLAPAAAYQAELRTLSGAAALADAAIQRAAENHRKAEADIRRLREGVAEQVRRSPTATDLPQFLQRIATLADEYGLQIAQLVPQPAHAQDGRLVSDVQVTARGEMLGLAHLLDRLRRENPYYSLLDYSIARPREQADDRCTLIWTLRLNMLADEGRK